MRLPWPFRRRTPSGFVDIDVELTDDQVAHLIMAGMFTRIDGKVLVITPKGSAWLRAYCDEQLAKHRGKCKKTGHEMPFGVRCACAYPESLCAYDANPERPE